MSNDNSTGYNNTKEIGIKEKGPEQDASKKSGVWFDTKIIPRTSSADAPTRLLRGFR